MGTAARDVITRFWELQNDRQYTKLLPLSADDAVFEDPLYGRLEGIAAITAFMEKMEKVMATNGTSFELALAGDDETAWSEWIAHTAGGDLPGMSLYGVHDGLITYDADDIDTLKVAQMQARPAPPPV